VGSRGAPALALVRGAKLRLLGVHVTGGSEGLALGGGLCGRTPRVRVLGKRGGHKALAERPS
jgi:hypothetical protein